MEISFFNKENNKMGEYASIMINDYILYSFKNYLDNDFVSLFFSKNNLEVKGSSKKTSREYKKCIYKATIKQAKDRFDCLGYGLRNFQLLFANLQYDDFEYDYKLLKKINYDEKKLKQIRNKEISFKKWTNSLSKIIRYEINNATSGSKFPEDLATTFCDKLILNSLENDNDSIYGINYFVNNIIPFIYRVILEFFDDNDSIELDFTDLQYWDDKSISNALSNTGQQEKTIVLVEGPTDKKILDFCISKLYPHLSDLVYIMDFGFGEAKRAGGSSFVSNNFKTFFLSNIKSRVIALFDNDAQGYQSECLLRNTIKNLPNNMKILRYPDLKCFKNYPTVFPNNRVVNDDINKRASSIELYLPDDFISEKGKFLPIEWESRIQIKKGNVKTYMYQGVITKKELIQKKFDNYINQISKHAIQFNSSEWNKMKHLLDGLLFAFK